MYIIQLQSQAGTSFICGGTYRINGKRYAKASDFYFDAKRFRKASQAAAYADRLSKKCCNLTSDKDLVFIEAE